MKVGLFLSMILPLVAMDLAAYLEDDFAGLQQQGVGWVQTLLAAPGVAGGACHFRHGNPFRSGPHDDSTSSTAALVFRRIPIDLSSNHVARSDYPNKDDGMLAFDTH